VGSVSWEGLREATDDLRYLRTLEWMLDHAKSPAAGRIRTSLDTLRSDVPKGNSLRLLAGNEHDRVDTVDRSKYVEQYRRRVAAWINELLAAEPGGFTEIRPGGAAAANPRGR
jgi:hypothetical protein